MPTEDPESRRDFLGGLFTSAGKIVHRRLGQTSERSSPTEGHVESYLPIHRPPDSVRVMVGGEQHFLQAMRGGYWDGPGLALRTMVLTDRIRFVLECESPEPVEWICIRWQDDIRGIRRYLSGPSFPNENLMEWTSERADRIYPWYFLAYDGKRTHGYGVAVRPKAKCFWSADRTGITLWINVRNGGKGVDLSGREVELCEALSREGDVGETAFQAHVAFCQHMSPYPRSCGYKVFGLEMSWLGQATLDAAKRVSELSPNVPNRPFAILQGLSSEDDAVHIANNLRDIGVRPGVELSLPLGLDLSEPEEAEEISRDIERFRDAGFELIQHKLPEVVTGPRQTSAETWTELLERLRYATGPAQLSVVGGESHHAAGMAEIMRLRTSGTREEEARLGPNWMAYAGAQSGSLYEVGIGPTFPGPWHHWTDLSSESGMAWIGQLSSLNLAEGDWSDIERAFAKAVWERPVAEPVEWMNATSPTNWRTEFGDRQFQWTGPHGPDISL